MLALLSKLENMLSGYLWPNSLQEEQLTSYLRDGYLIVKGLFSNEEINKIAAVADDLKYKWPQTSFRALNN